MEIELALSLPMDTSASVNGKVEPLSGPNIETRVAVTFIKVYTDKETEFLTMC